VKNSTTPAFQNPDADPYAHHDIDRCRHAGPYCPGCGKQAGEIPSVVQFAEEDSTAPETWVRHEEGTYNPTNEHFLCDACFLAEESRRGGRLVGPHGQQWVCP